MNPAKKICSTIVALVLVFCAMPFSQAQAANDPETLFYVEDLGNGITVETTITIYPGVTRNQSTSAISSSEFKNNGITAGVTGTEYSKSLASGWSYTNHKITTTNVSSSSGGTATLTATLKDFPINVPVRLSLHCASNGAITRG